MTAIKTKDFRVLPVGTVLDQELRDSIFQALQDRDKLIQSFEHWCLERTTMEAVQQQLVEQVERLKQQKVTMSPEDFSWPTGDMDKPDSEETTDGNA